MSIRMQFFGLKSCDTCRKALADLRAAGREPNVRDVRTEPVSRALIDELLEEFGTEKLINRRSTTWRGLSDKERRTEPADLLANHPTLLKRPVIVDGPRRSVGWDAAARAIHIG